MPEYVERTWVFPVPGAFGLERSKSDWERRHRANVQYLTRTGYYADKLYIYVDEEYGYASRLWVYPGSARELVDDYVHHRVPWTLNRFKGECDSVSFHTPPSERGTPFPRKLELILVETGQVIEGFNHISDFDGEVHYHEDDDSYLRIDYFEVRGLRSPVVTIHVLDALAAL